MPVTITLTESEYRKITTAKATGNIRRAVKIAIGILRRSGIGKVHRLLDLALMLLDLVIAPDNSAFEVSEGFGQWSGYYPGCMNSPQAFGHNVYKSVGCIGGQYAPAIVTTDASQWKETYDITYRSGGYRHTQIREISGWTHTLPDIANSWRHEWSAQDVVQWVQPTRDPQPFKTDLPWLKTSVALPSPRSFPAPKSGARPGAPGSNPPTTYRPPLDLPKPNVKDKKFIIGLNNATALGKFISAVTETNDFIDCAYKALPAKVRYRNGSPGKVPTPQHKAGVIAANGDELDVGKFLGCLVSNHFEDKFYGKLGKLAGQAARRSGRSTGYQTGGWDTAMGDHNPHPSNVDIDLVDGGIAISFGK